MKIRVAKKHLRRELMSALQVTMQSDSFREISGLEELIAALKATAVCQDAFLIEPFGERVVNTVTRIIARRAMKKRYRLTQAARPKQHRIKSARVIMEKKQRAVRPPKVSRPERMKRQPFPYVELSQSYAKLHKDIIRPLLTGQRESLPTIGVSGVFSVYLGRYEGGGLVGNQFAGGAYVGGVIMKIRWRWTGRRLIWKLQQQYANDGTVATWNRSQVWKKAKLPISLQYFMRDQIGVDSHLVQDWQNLAIAI